MKRCKLLSIGILLFTALACSKSSEEKEIEEVVDKSLNRKDAGDSANDLLGNVAYDTLHIEAVYVTGQKPTATAMANLETFVKQHTQKLAVTTSYHEVASPEEEKLSLQKIAEIEEDQRSVYNTGRTIALYMYFADALAEDDDEDNNLVTLGAVYRNTSMISYAATIKKLAARSSSVTVSDIETATYNHEFGHLLGLVNLGSTMQINHEETRTNDNGEVEGINHCNVDGCLMRAELLFNASGKNITPLNQSIAPCALSSKSVLAMLESKTAKDATAPELGPQCKADLIANGGR